MVRLFVNKYSEYHIINVDKLTYAGNLANLGHRRPGPNYIRQADICDFDAMLGLMRRYGGGRHHTPRPRSHVDRSIKDPFTFARTNVMGTLSLLQAAKVYWESLPGRLRRQALHHISTDEVYGALELTNPEGVESPFSTKASSSTTMPTAPSSSRSTPKHNPHSPYSASKASSDHFVRAFHDTYGMPTIVTNCSNNHGPYQFPRN